MSKPPKPHAVAALFRRLPTRKERQEFLRLIGFDADQLHALLDDFSQSESERFLSMIFRDFGEVMSSTIIDVCLSVVEEMPTANRALLREAVAARVQANAEAMMETAHADAKKSRDRKPEPENARHYLYVCWLKERDPKRWSHAQLKRLFGFPKDRISKILKQKLKWKELGEDAGASEEDLASILKDAGLHN